MRCADAPPQISACTVHFTGALLLDPHDASLLDENLCYAAARPPRDHAPAEPRAADGAAAFMDADEDGCGGWGGGWSDDEAAPPPGEARAAAPCEEADDEPDPWAPLDLSDPAGLPVRPYRKARVVPRRPVQPSARQTAQEARAAKRSGAVFPEFAYAYEARSRTQAKQRAAAQRAQAAARPASAQMAEAEDDEDDGGGFADYGGGDDGGWGEEGAMPALDEAALEEAAAAGAAPPPLRAFGPAGGAAGSDEPSYEELVRAHVESYLAAAAAAETQSELAVRVAGWKSRIEPQLAEQEARPVFDIHAAGAEVMQQLQPPADGAAEAHSFAQLEAGQPAYAVARAFAATLQLVNAGNVELAAAADGASFSLTLLSLSSATEVLDAYRAPSLTQPGAEAAAPAQKGGKRKAAKGAARPIDED